MRRFWVNSGSSHPHRFGFVSFISWSVLGGLLTRSYLGKHSELPMSFFWTITPHPLNSGSGYLHIPHELLLFREPYGFWARTAACTGYTGNKNTQEILMSLCGPFVGWKHLSGSLAIPGLCTKQTTIWTTEGPRGLDYRGLFCLDFGIIPWFFFTPPDSQIFPVSQFIL